MEYMEDMSTATKLWNIFALKGVHEDVFPLVTFKRPFLDFKLRPNTILKTGFFHIRFWNIWS